MVNVISLPEVFLVGEPAMGGRDLGRLASGVSLVLVMTLVGGGERYIFLGLGCIM